MKWGYNVIIIEEKKFFSHSVLDNNINLVSVGEAVNLYHANPCLKNEIIP